MAKKKKRVPKTFPTSIPDHNLTEAIEETVTPDTNLTEEPKHSAPLEKPISGKKKPYRRDKFAKVKSFAQQHAFEIITTGVFISVLIPYLLSLRGDVSTIVERTENLRASNIELKTSLNEIVFKYHDLDKRGALTDQEIKSIQSKLDEVRSLLDKPRNK